MKTFAAVALVLACATGIYVNAQSNTSEEAAVRAALDHYIQGHATGKGEEFSKVFHPESKLFWIADGQLRTRTSAEYIAGASGKPAADEDKRRRKITMVDVAGNAAVARIELDYPDVKFVDYMALLKIDGRRQIVNKTFYADRRPARTAD
jgi:hypothetical protein